MPTEQSMFAGNTGLTLAQGPWIEGFSSWILGFQALGFRARLGFKVFGVLALLFVWFRF